MKLIFAGGIGAKNSQITTGLDVVKKFTNINGDLNILNAQNLHPKYGVSHSVIEEAEIKQLISEMSSKLIVVTTPESLNSIATSHVCRAELIDYLIVDLEPGSPLLTPYYQGSTEVIKVN